MNQCTRREAECKECLEQFKEERANIKRHLTRQQILIEHQRQELQQQKDITDDEKKKKSKKLRNWKKV
jgi:hypothetical protein